MKRPAMLLVGAAFFLCGCSGNDILSYVDPEIGGVGVLLQPTRPTVQIPNQMIRWSPARTDLLDQYISDYPLTLTSHRQQSVFGFLPFNLAYHGFNTQTCCRDIWTASEE